jgi:polysaccharide deacetylase family protein (PEP-CTERM system associated)
MNRTVFLTFDVEEWFQVANLRGAIKPSDWDQQKSTVEQNVNRILDILEKFDIYATFFILGWVAERHPEVVKAIHEKGHEVASHGYAHELSNQLSDLEARNDLKKAKVILEDIIIDKVVGYRAPNFSIDDRILRILKELGYLYDSSYNPFRLNPRYGSLEGIRDQIAPDCYSTTSGIYEIPLSQYAWGKIPVPIGGGAYFRIIPFRIFKNLVRSRIQKENVYNFYLHPWEFEPEQQRIKNIRFDYRLRHYYGLGQTANKLEKLILFLKNMDCEFLTIRKYIERIIA